MRLMSGHSSGRIRISVPARLAYRDAVGALVKAVCVQLEETRQARPGTGDEVLSAFNEAFNNLALHAYRGGETGAADIEVELLPGQIVLRLMDRGQGFDPTRVTPPDLASDEVSEGGYGLFIMRSFMSEVAYQRGDGERANVLTLVRNLEQDRPGEQRNGHDDVQKD